MRLYTAREWQGMGWYGREAVRARRLALVAQLEREHVAAYGTGHRILDCTPAGWRVNVRRGRLNAALDSPLTAAHAQTTHLQPQEAATA